MEIRVPEVGESVREALLAKWFFKDGEMVKLDEPVCEIETDKITLDINADASGLLSISVAEGSTIPVGTVIGVINEVAAVASSAEKNIAIETAKIEPSGSAPSSPAVRREMLEKGIDPASVSGSGKGGRITLNDLFAGIENSSKSKQEQLEPKLASSIKPPAVTDSSVSDILQKESLKAISNTELNQIVTSVNDRSEERKEMSPLRKRIAERLLSVRKETAMLTTFNEVDLTNINLMRKKHQDSFQKRYGVKLGYMSFFVKACVEALREFPAVNASIDGNDIVYHNYYDIGVAIGGEKGLVVPILRNSDKSRLYDIELAIKNFGEKIKNNRLLLSDLEGGTFTISNGGIYGSMLSTPILNPPQSAILGMHAIQERPVAREGQVVIRPMMYLALSYDHRIIDGREAVGFLKSVKRYIDDPEEFLLV